MNPLTKVTRAAAKAASASQARDNAIREAAKTHTIRAIAAAAGISSSRVHQIIHAQVPIIFGLRAQGHLEKVETMRLEGASWTEIGKAIGWAAAEVERFYGYEIH